MVVFKGDCHERKTGIKNLPPPLFKSLKMKAIHDVTGGRGCGVGAWLCYSPGSVFCPGCPFQDSNPLVETQMLVIELQPDPERPRDSSHSQNHYLQETGKEELYFNQPPLGPFNRPFWR